MSDRTKKLAIFTGMLLVLLCFFSRILFTDKIIRAPDIIGEFYWGVRGIRDMKFLDILPSWSLQASWNMMINSGYSVEGGDVSLAFLVWRNLLFWLIPAPESVAWFIVLHLFFGACGTYLCCRVIGASRLAAFLGGLIFVLAPENASLINAGHVMKIATICYAPWAFYFLERGFQTRRVIFFLTTAFVLAFQFFNTHWQIAFYTCLCVGAYGICRLLGIVVADKDEGRKLFPRLFGMNMVLLVFFLTTVAISLLPLANWSKDTNRGVQSGANQAAGSSAAKGGLDVEEAMSWSLPPEELGAFVIPGFFGLSRQEAGDNPPNIASYYWGRMRFTQTVSYMGLIPWLLLPLPLIFRRDKYTWLSLGGIVGGILFSMGKYTPFYWMLYRFFPGINHFRVPKMMMFIPVLGLAILAARGIDLIRDEEVRKTKEFFRYLLGITVLPIVLFVLLGIERAGADHWMGQFMDMLAQPTRYEQGPQLVGQRWANLVRETALAGGLAAVCAAVFWMLRKPRLVAAVPWLLLLLFVGDTWRINDKFLFLTEAPVKAKAGEVSPLLRFLKSTQKTWRVLPMDGSDPMQYVSEGIPVMFTSNAVQQMRWQQFLDGFNPLGPMPDIVNVKYLIIANESYQQQKGLLGNKFAPVFTAPGGATVVLENRNVLPKGWLVPAAAVINEPAQRVGIMQNPGFNPAAVALVESPPSIAMANPDGAVPLVQQRVTVPVYEGNRIVVDAAAPVNTLLVLGEKYYKGWYASVDGNKTEIVPVDHILRGVYLTPGPHRVEFVFDPLPFKVGKWLTLASFALFAVMLGREWWLRRRVEGAS
ncbi:YfhO family protein [Oryzomonas rubra]|uniref:Membrane protein YfhO n=1 Tax=Oryzomonas rubra TaxID=2509454 RepID=A0A5A9XJP6_9BACT|nr:YfhO family protein [Oryzomonas rubra]KAA0893316.1 hypothetical protein ET418_05730 [Oryzomonas rubra]